MNAELRVLIVSPDFPPDSGGVQILMARLAEHLPDAVVRVVTFDAPGAPAFDREAGLDVRRVRRFGGTPKLRIAALAARALAEARNFDCDVVLVAHVAAFPVGALIRRLLDIPWVLYVHADEFRVWPRACAHAVRRADAVIAVSNHSAGLARSSGVAPERLHVILNGVDAAPAAPAESSAARRPTVLTVARMVDRYKGHDLMLRAIPLVAARVPDVRWVVVGDGPLRASCQTQAVALGIQEHVSFEGNVSDFDRDRWLDSADVFAMPARLPPGGLGGEGFGIVFLEAAAHGLPVVAGAEGGAVDAVDDGRTGVLVDPHDHLALADALTDLLTDQGRSLAMGQAGREWAARFSWPSRGAELAAVLRSVTATTATG